VSAPEWADAFRKGDPEAIGQALHLALTQAANEMRFQSEPAWDDLTQHTRAQLIRAGEILREHGLTIPGVPDVN
jgi:hypothetical protein